MMKMDLGTGSGSKIFQLNDEDIELIVRLLHQESDYHVFMVNDYVNFADHVSPFELIDDIVKFLEENVIHCAMDNNYK